MDNIIFGMIILAISVVVGISLYKSLMKKLGKSNVELSDFEVVYKFVIPLILSFIVMNHSIKFIVELFGFSMNSFIPYILGSIILVLFFAIYDITLNILLKKLKLDTK